MKDILNIRLLVALNLFALSIVVIIAAWMYHQAERDLRVRLHENIEKQHSVLLALALETDRNGADEIVAEVVQDCSARNDFEELLQKLGELSSKELLTVQQLFDACGDFYAVRKGFMVARLSREYEILREYGELQNIFSENVERDRTYVSWGNLVELEEQRKNLLREQVVLQREIIAALIKGSRIGSVTIETNRQKAQNIAEQLAVLDVQIDTIRDVLGGEIK